MTILVDCDNVLNNLSEVVLKHYNEDYNDNLEISDITKYHMENFVKEEAKENFKDYFIDKTVWKEVTPTAGALDVIERLRKRGDRVFLCTKTEPFNAFKKSRWCEREFGFNPHKDFILTPDKTIIRASLLIDDCTKNFSENHSSWICMNYPWNQTFRTRNFFDKKVNNWEEIGEFLLLD